mmetsp:Transcript_12131/g.30713  ORF Transcript_12131/g.30713 Transcript_12131/m.30713 type:complete len:207 (+) Transcript_12131:164-784(+)
MRWTRLTAQTHSATTITVMLSVQEGRAVSSKSFASTCAFSELDVTISHASCSLMESHSPSLAIIRCVSEGVSRNCSDTYGSAVRPLFTSSAFANVSPMARVTAKPTQRRLWVGASSTPNLDMRSRSLGSDSRWFSDSETATPFLHRTAVESPTLATCRKRSRRPPVCTPHSSATVAVQPWHSKRSSFAIICSVTEKELRRVDPKLN